MDDLVVVAVVPTELEASLLCGILRDGGFKCISRPTNAAAGIGAAGGFRAAGPREVVVRAEDATRARQVIASRRPV